MMSEDEFIGEFKKENYTLTRQYIQTETPMVELYHTRYSPSNPKCTIAIVHGYGEHAGRFHEIAEFFAKNSMEVIIVDQRGFGYSGGGKSSEVLDLQNDILVLVKTAKTNLPLYIFGHSLGGLISTSFILNFKEINIAGCVLTAPFLGLDQKAGSRWVLKKILSIYGAFFENFLIAGNLGVSALCKNQKIRYNLFKDGRLVGNFTGKLMSSIIHSVDELDHRKQQFDCPLLIMHGKKDVIVKWHPSQSFINSNPKPYKELHLFEDGYHELKYDEEKEEMFDRSLKFINKINQEAKPVGKIDSQPLKPKPKPSNLLLNIIVLGIVFVIVAQLLGII